MSDLNAAGESQLRAVLDFVETAALVVECAASPAEVECRVVLYNRCAETLFGRAPAAGEFGRWEQACGFHQADPNAKRPTHRCPPGDLPWNRAQRGEQVQRASYFLRNEQHRSGLWVLADARAEQTGGSMRVLVSVRDISARRRAEQAMRAARRMSRSLFEDSQVPIVRSTVDGRILDCNKAFVRVTGYDSMEEVRMQRASQLHVPGGREPMMAELIKKGSLSEYPIEFRRKDGSRGWAVGSIQLVEPGPDEFEWSIIATLVDITAHRRAEVARVQSEMRFAEFMRYMPGVAFIKDPYGRYLFYSESSMKMLSVDAASVIGKTDDQMWPAAVAEQFRKTDQEVVAQGRVIHVKEDVPLADGVHRWSIFKFPIPNEAGELTLIGGVGVDETERWNLERRLVEAEKMEAIGRLAGGVAHDFNNVLTVISGYAQMLADAITRKVAAEKLAVYVEEILGSSQRASDLTDQLLAFGRRKVVRPARIELKERVAETESMLRRVIGDHVELVVEASPEPCYVCADPGQMERVIMNLVVNARDAMPQGGQVTIRIEPAAADQVPAGLEGPGFVLLEVRDTGSGIDPAIRPHIFEPFYTSKPKGKGTGLGLSTVYGIVKQTGGEIAVKSESGVGTAFQLFLPVSTEGAPAVKKKSADPVTRVLNGNEIILVVEDDPTVRALVKVMLEKYGYRPLMADGGKEALRIFREREAEIQMLLTDVIMPQMSGRELALMLQDLAPGLKVLYMSGYTDEEIATRGLVNAAHVLLHKPFGAEALARRVREVLDTPVPKGRVSDPQSRKPERTEPQP